MFSYLPSKVVGELIERVIKNLELGILDVYIEVEDKINSKRFDLFKKLLSRFENSLIQFKFDSLDNLSRGEAIELLNRTSSTIKKTLRKLEK